MVDCWPCQVAGTPILDRIGCPGVVLATGTPAGVSRVGGVVVLALSSRHRHTLRACTFTDCPFGYCRPRDFVSRDHENRRFSNDLRRTVRNPLRSDRFLHYCRAACQLNVTAGNSIQAFGRWKVSQCDGAYPRPEGRGIAPVQHITLSPLHRWLGPPTRGIPCGRQPFEGQVDWRREAKQEKPVSERT